MLTGQTTLRVRYPEADPMGVAHHSRFFVWFEIGRTELMREAGCTYAGLEAEGFRLPVVEASCRYHSPARYDEEIRLITTLDRVSRATVSFTYRAERLADARLIAGGATRHACTDRRGMPCRLPARLVSLLADGGAPR